jgi:ABC-type glycerol-3-phosphate transport system permease component
MSKIIFKIGILAVLLFASLESVAQGCSQCRARIETASGDDLTVGNGINFAILFLMMIPYLILFFLFRKKIVGFFRDFTAMWK